VTDDHARSEQATTDDHPPVALVTGAAGGIGRATVARFRASGWRVYATDADATTLAGVDWDTVAADADHSAGGETGTVVTAPLDVTSDADRDRVLDRVAAEAGRLDCLVNLAGYALPGAVLDTEPAAVRQLYEVLVHGPTALVRRAFDLLVAGGGRVVTVTSSLWWATFPGTGHYGAAKAAAARTTEALRIECLDTPVSATTVEPAWVDTPFEARADGRLPDPADRRAAFDRYLPVPRPRPTPRRRARGRHPRPRRPGGVSRRHCHTTACGLPGRAAGARAPDRRTPPDDARGPGPDCRRDRSDTAPERPRTTPGVARTVKCSWPAVNHEHGVGRSLRRDGRRCPHR